MQRFWESIIEPALKVLKPKVIVEIGAGSGKNTRKLIEFCGEHGAKLHAIDPEPGFDTDKFTKNHGDYFVFHKALSLDTIGKIGPFDAVLIDGDHNWYTVYNELKLIERCSEEMPFPFPLVMLHDTGWPYGRRDLYYNPENIPTEFRKTYEKKGILPGSSGLLDEGGLNRAFFNAITEGGPQNGVLTAIEDFVKGDRDKYAYYNIPGLNGLCIILPKQMENEDTALSQFIEGIKIGNAIQDHINKLEGNRIKANIARLKSFPELSLSNFGNEEFENRTTHELLTQKDKYEDIVNSKSWKMTAPLRFCERTITKLYKIIKKAG